MAHHFSKHYDVEEAKALIPKVREWINQLWGLKEEMKKNETRLSSLAKPEADRGGDTVNRWARAAASFNALLREFRKREIFIKDLDRGLIDFPSLRAGREVFLCWQMGENDIEFWHDLDSGFTGREKL